MVSLTLFFIGASPMIAIDSCTHYQHDLLAEKVIMVYAIPRPNMEMLLLNTDILSLDEIADISEARTNSQKVSVLDSVPSLRIDKPHEDKLPNNNIPIQTTQNTLFFDKYLLNILSDISIAKGNDNFAHYLPNT